MENIQKCLYEDMHDFWYKLVKCFLDEIIFSSWVVDYLLPPWNFKRTLTNA